MACPTNSSTSHFFRTAVDAVLKNWTALQLAVSQGAGGHQSQAIGEWMAGAVVQWFSENQNLEPYEVTEFLEQIINQEFNLLIDDGSSDEIGTMICDFYRLCTSNKSTDEIISKIHSLPKCDLTRCQVSDKNEGNELDHVEKQMDSMEVDSPVTCSTANSLSNVSSDRPNCEADSDGWVVVERKKR